MCKLVKLTEAHGLCDSSDTYPTLNLPLESILRPGPVDIAVEAAYDIIINSGQWDYCEIEHHDNEDENMGLECAW